MAAVPHPSKDSADVWDEAPYIVVLTHDALYAKKFDTESGREKAMDKLDAGSDPHTALGLLTKTIVYDALRSAAVVPEMGVLVVQGGRLQDPLRAQFPYKEAALAIFERLRERFKESQGGAWETRFGKANANDVPLDPQLGIAVFFGVVAILGLIMGALEGVPDQGFILAIALAWLGNLLGKVGSFLLAGVAIVAAVYCCLTWVKSLPPKLTMRRE